MAKFHDVDGVQFEIETTSNLWGTAGHIWDTNLLIWTKQTAAAAGGGGPVSIADGDDFAQGSVSDVAWVSGDGTVISILKAIAGGGTTSASAPTAATVGIGSAQVLASNVNRKGVIFVNTSSNTISFGIGASATLNSGITLVPNGVWEMDQYTFSTSAITAIASQANSNLAIQEFS
jgi:hypothetical protein